MKIVILLCLLALLAKCDLLPVIAGVAGVGDEDGVVKCISDRAAALA